jgi:hypothetical protein
MSTPTPHDRDAASRRELIIKALSEFVQVHGEVSDDPDDVISAASAIWDALGINTWPPEDSDSSQVADR